MSKLKELLTFPKLADQLLLLGTLLLDVTTN